jgi:hypothetical protein
MSPLPQGEAPPPHPLKPGQQHDDSAPQPADAAGSSPRSFPIDGLRNGYPDAAAADATQTVSMQSTLSTMEEDQPSGTVIRRRLLSRSRSSGAAPGSDAAANAAAARGSGSFSSSGGPSRSSPLGLAPGGDSTERYRGYRDGNNNNNSDGSGDEGGVPLGGILGSFFNDKEDLVTLTYATMIGVVVATSVFFFDVSIQYIHDLPDIFAVGGGMVVVVVVYVLVVFWGMVVVAWRMLSTIPTLCCTQHTLPTADSNRRQTQLTQPNRTPHPEPRRRRRPRHGPAAARRPRHPLPLRDADRRRLPGGRAAEQGVCAGAQVSDARDRGRRGRLEECHAAEGLWAGDYHFTSCVFQSDRATPTN